MKTPEVVLTPLPYTTIIDPRGDFRMSSHTALVTDAAAEVFRRTPGMSVFIPGESTFGPEYPSTASLMRDQLIKKGVPEGKIEIQDNLNDTESQLHAIQKKGITNPVIVDMDFHDKRVNVLRRQLGIQGTTMIAEKVILQRHKGATPERLKKFAATNTNMFGMSKVMFAETVGRTGAKMGRVGKIAVNMIRRILKAEGATVTDYHHVEPAQKHFNDAINDSTVITRFGTQSATIDGLPVVEQIRKEKVLAQKKAA